MPTINARQRANAISNASLSLRDIAHSLKMFRDQYEGSIQSAVYRRQLEFIKKTKKVSGYMACRRYLVVK